jgi:citrate synthase
MNTASCISRITFINGAKGILRYRGSPILKYFSGRVMRHTYIHENLKTMMKSFRYDAHPMGMLISTITAMSTYHPEANPALVGMYIHTIPLFYPPCH